MRDATVTTNIAPSMFPAPTTNVVEPPPTHQPNMSRRRVDNAPMQRKKSVASDDFGDLDLDDDALVKASCSDLDFDHIDNFADPVDAITRSNTAKNKPAKDRGHARVENDPGPAPVRLSNGRWCCNHKCKDKEGCKHYCCKHGLDKPPKKVVPKHVPTDEHHDPPLSKISAHKDSKTQTKLHLQVSKRKGSAAIEELDLTQQEKKRKNEYAVSGPHDYRGLHSLHRNVQKKDMPASLHSVMKTRPAYCYGKGGEHQLSFLSQVSGVQSKTSSEYGDLHLDDFTAGPSAPQNATDNLDDLTSLHFSNQAPTPSRGSSPFGDESSIFGEATTGLADSPGLRAQNQDTSNMQNNEAHDATDGAEDWTDADYPMDLDLTATEDVSHKPPTHAFDKTGARDRHAQPTETRAPFFEATSSPEQARHFKPATSMPHERGPRSHAAEEEDEDEDEDMYSDLLNMLDMSLATNDKENRLGVHPPARVKAPAQSIETEQEEPEQIPDGFNDLQPWLFQEFGDIVELVDE